MTPELRALLEAYRGELVLAKLTDDMDHKISEVSTWGKLYDYYFKHMITSSIGVTAWIEAGLKQLRGD